MEKRDLIPGDIVQINPDYKAPFGGQLLVVQEPKSFGCLGYILGDMQGLAVTYKRRAYLLPKWEDMEYVGRLVWEMVEEDASDGN